MAVPVLAVPGQVNDMIVGSNTIKHEMQHLKTTQWYWDNLSQPTTDDSEDLLMNMLANVDRWQGK